MTSEVSETEFLTELMYQIQIGSEVAFSEFYEKTIDRVFNFSNRILRSPEDVEEAVCDIYTQIWNNAGSFSTSKGNILAWTMMITRSRSLDLYRRRSKLDLGSDPDMELIDPAAHAEHLLDSFQTASAVHTQLLELSEIQRQIIALSFFRDFSHQQISKMLSMPIGTVKSHIRRGLSALLVKVGSRGFYTLTGNFASFDPGHASVEVWLPDGIDNAPIMIYAHGGAGYRDDDRKRVEMFRKNGFVTISFDSYEMNGFQDWNFVTRKISNKAKQKMIWHVFEGAVEFAAQDVRWDTRNIFFYGGSNGGRVVLYAGSKFIDLDVRGIISEAPAATGYRLEPYTTPTIVPFGMLDNWAGKSSTDFVWNRVYPNSPISIEAWLMTQKARGHCIDFIFYENAGHLMFDGPLKEVTIKRGNNLPFTAYKGANKGALRQYERDIFNFIEKNLAE